MKRTLLFFLTAWLGWIPTAAAQYERSPLRDTVTFPNPNGGNDTVQIWIEDGLKFRGKSVGWGMTQMVLKRDLVVIYKDVWPEEYESFSTRVLNPRLIDRDLTYIPLGSVELLLPRLNVLGTFSAARRYSFLQDPDDSLVVVLKDRRSLAAARARDFGEKQTLPSERLARAQPQLRWWCRGRPLYSTEELQALWPSLGIPGKPDRVNMFLAFVPNGGRSFSFNEIVSIRVKFNHRWIELTRQSGGHTQAALTP